MPFNIDSLLEKAYKAGASDVHLNCNKTPVIRINGEIFKISDSIITSQDIKEITNKTLFEVNPENLQDIDYAYEIKDVARFRVNYCKDISGGKLTFRIIPYKIKDLAELSLPEYLKEFTKFNNGIVLVTGATGCGKSTTLASLIELINQTKKGHIITIEDPVEFIYEDKKSLITQRNLGLDVKDFKTGIRCALRQDPDVILVGEIRDKDTLYSAIEAAETGHLVYSTLHTNGTIPCVDRLLGFINEIGQDDFLQRLTGCIRAIIHQNLVPAIEGTLVPAVEILTFTSTVIDYISKKDLGELAQLMTRSRHASITTMNQSLYELYEKGIITKETAYQYSLERVEMEQMLRGMHKNKLNENIV